MLPSPAVFITMQWQQKTLNNKTLLLSQSLRVSMILKVTLYLLTMCSFCHPDNLVQIGSCRLEGSFIARFKSQISSFQQGSNLSGHPWFLICPYCDGFGDADIIKMQFASVFDNRDALLAAVTLPKFKVRWLREEERREALKTLLTTECRSFPHYDQDATLEQQTPTSSSSENYFFAFDEDDTASFNSDTEVIEYLKAGSEMDFPNHFPTIKTIYMKFNTATPSSAPVQRLFSLGSLVLTPRRNRLSERRFERLVLMRFNHYFTDKHVK